MFYFFGKLYHYHHNGNSWYSLIAPDPLKSYNNLRRQYYQSLFNRQETEAQRDPCLIALQSLCLTRACFCDGHLVSASHPPHPLTALPLNGWYCSSLWLLLMFCSAAHIATASIPKYNCFCIWDSFLSAAPQKWFSQSRCWTFYSCISKLLLSGAAQICAH